MNRVIKFRGKRPDNGKWYFGSLVTWQNGYVEIIDEKENKAGREKITVLPKTVGQFTGLKDKDGKEIYEGDIITIKYDKEEVYVRKLIRYIPELSAFCSANIKELGLKFIYPYSSITQEYINELHFEVIGNIHDNPDLLN